MTPGARLTAEVLAAALGRAADRSDGKGRLCVAVGQYGTLHRAAPHEIERFARLVVAELAELERAAAPHVVEGEEPTEASGSPGKLPPRPRTTTRGRFG